MPISITAVRHGESESNAAARRAEAEGRALVLPGRDEDVELTDLGRSQATLLGRRLAAGTPPEAVWCSPYRRAVRTWELIAAELPAAPEVRLDARLGDRRMGLLSGMNLAAIAERFPQEAEVLVRGEDGYRPPEGESFADVIARVREAVGDLRAACAGRHVLVVAHDAVVLAIRHVLLEAAGDLEHTPIGNTSVSVWRAGEMELFNDVAHLRELAP
ncbi:histidine phosphatase family protein [Planomonospora corallina]|uniref:Histidine phosphatase family protein n=1 Tax=Planomonospora corallina TaxID=1806052 RepID=A0ABV8IJS7_9ACTN